MVLNEDMSDGPVNPETPVAVATPAVVSDQDATSRAQEGGLNWEQFDRNHPQVPVGGQGVDTQAPPGKNYVQAEETSDRLTVAAPVRAPEIGPLSGQAPTTESPQRSVPEASAASVEVAATVSQQVPAAEAAPAVTEAAQQATVNAVPVAENIPWYKKIFGR